jgi:hypothetical protein
MSSGMIHSVRPTKSRVSATLEVIDPLTATEGRVSLRKRCSGRHCQKAACRRDQRYFTLYY